jgi:hypothetical protein
MTDHFECRIDQIELFGDVFAQRFEIAAAGRTRLLCRLQYSLLVWQMRRQRLAR